MKKTTWLILIVAALVIAIDQLSKYAVAAALPVGGAWSSLPGENPVIRIIHVYNTGVTFGLFKDLGVVSIVIALLVTGMIIFYSRILRNDQRLTCVALGLMLGGGIGNMIDRIRLGHVIDFIDAGFGPMRWYTSNVADISIVLGVILLGIALFVDDHRGRKKTHTDKPPASRTPIETQ